MIAPLKETVSNAGDSAGGEPWRVARRLVALAFWTARDEVRPERLSWRGWLLAAWCLTCAVAYTLRMLDVWP